MKIASLLTLTFFCCFARANAQSDSVAESQKKLDQAASRLIEVQREHADLRRHLYNEVNQLDDEVITLAKELRQLERDEELRTSDKKKLEKDIETRKNQFTYTSGLLNQY